MARTPCIYVALVVAACSGAPARPPPARSATLAVRCGRLIDGQSDAPRTDAAVLIRGERIAAVVAAGRIPRGTPVLDLAGHTCLPGLIDAHVHLADSPDLTGDLKRQLDRSFAQVVEASRVNAVRTLQAGFTTVRDAGCYQGWPVRELRDRINRGEVVGPRILVPGFYLTRPGGGGDLVIPGIPEEKIPARMRIGVSRGVAGYRESARRAVRGGADFVKIIASGAVLAFGGVPGAPEMSADEIDAVVQVARAAGLPVAAHAHGPLSIKQAILAGVRTIEHAALIDEEGIALAKKHQVALVMDVYNADYIDQEGRRKGWPAEFLRKNLEVAELQRRRMMQAHRAGAPLVFGTDAGVFPHGTNAEQLRTMVGLGMPAMAAIKSATSAAAEHIGWRDRVGRVAPGLYADLIAVKGDPLREVGLLRRVAVVIKGGKLVRGPGAAQAAAPTWRRICSRSSRSVPVSIW